MSSFLKYRNIASQIEEKRKRLTHIRILIQRLEEEGKPIDLAKMNLRNLLTEIRILQNKIQQIYPLKKASG